MRNPSRRRPMHTAVLNALLLSVSVVFLSGCMAAPAPPVPATPVAVASPEPTVTPPVFASNDEALAAATAAFGEYQSMSNTIAHEGGADPERISDFAVGKVLESDLETYAEFRAGGLRMVGDLAFDSFSIQSADLFSGAVTAYVCQDVRETDVVDLGGTTVTAPGRPDSYPLQVSLTHAATSNRLLVEKSDLWSGKNFC
ncbi:hypothetical protein [Cryobacterium sp. N19]|uniref:hypothetical protein n=1 Tax=Cryobacterium sp. N19 TaxID=2048288 RepID=UPI0013050284|nr:hypothetical protein [Cryobacterium sp. N19]